MANQIPTIKSYQQLFADAQAGFQASSGLNDWSTISLMTSFFSVVSLMVARASGDVLGILNGNSVDRAQGIQLVQLAADNNLTPIPAQVASGYVTIYDTSFTKISSKIYAGLPSPTIGSVQLAVQDASLFPSTGQVYVGRGTSSVEGPISYTSITPIGSYYQINLSSGLTKFHNINESVILAQGGVRVINNGILVTAPGTGLNPDISYTTTQSATILDGETTVENVSISAQNSGSQGNTPAATITQIQGAFNSAAVTNPLPVTSGRDSETDDQLRIRIKQTKSSIGFGTATAIQNAVIGAVAPDEQKTIIDAQIYSTGGETLLYIDDGTGYEEKTKGVGIETIVNSAIGGEVDFQLDTGGTQTSVAKAMLVCNLSAPYALYGNEELTISINGTSTTHVFQPSDFASLGSATAYEVSASINGDANLNFVALTQDGGTGVILTPKSDSVNEIAVERLTGVTDASVILGVPSGTFYTLNLFKNDLPLSQDGLKASIYSDVQSNWSPSVVDGVQLVISVDSTSTQTITFHDSDFIAIGAGALTNATPLPAWVTVLNSKVAGITASVSGTQLILTSNLGTDDRAALTISPSCSLVTAGVFTLAKGLTAVGKTSDYTFDRNTAQIHLNVPLVAGDSLSCGTTSTEGSVQSSNLNAPIVLSSDAYLWVVVDDPNAQYVNTGLSGSGSTITVSAIIGPPYTITYTSSITTAFSPVQVGDYAIIWSTDVSAANRLEGRVSAVGGAFFTLEVTNAEAVAAVAQTVSYTSGIVFVRTQKTPQKIDLVTGTYATLDNVVSYINNRAAGWVASNYKNTSLVLKTLTKNLDGAIMFVTANASGAIFGFTNGDLSVCTESQIAFEDSGTSEASFPSFFHSLISGDLTGNPSAGSFISAIGSTTTVPFNTTSFDANKQFVLANPYAPASGTSVYDSQAQYKNSIINLLSASTVTLPPTLTSYTSEFYERMRAAIDRFYLTENLCFGSADSLQVVVDKDSTNNTFAVPMYRNIKVTSSASSANFNATDTDGGNVAMTQFFTGFDFSNFKALMQAKWPMASTIRSAFNDKILYRSALWGRSGEKISVSYQYPLVASQALSSNVVNGPNTNINIVLPSGVSRATSYDNTTVWNVTVTSYTVGGFSNTDLVTFTYASGTTPLLGALTVGDYVNFSANTATPAFGNYTISGTYRLNAAAAPTTTSFSFVALAGQFTSQAGVTTANRTSLNFFASNPPVATTVVTYVNTNLSALISATGIIAATDTIIYSSAEDSDFGAHPANGSLSNFDTTVYGYYLLDGINYVASSAISSSPQFVLKNNIQLFNLNGYVFGSSNESISLVPVSLEQIDRFTSVLAVTGLNTAGTSLLTEGAQKLELASQTFGGDGAIQIVSGTANAANASLINSSYVSNFTYAVANLNSSQMLGFISDQIVKLTNSNLLSKPNIVDANTDVQFTTGSNLVTLSLSSITSRGFGNPRFNQITSGSTFKIEKQGILTCLSWNGSGANPNFSQAVNFNSVSTGSVSVSPTTGGAIYTSSANTDVNFAECTIGNSITIAYSGSGSGFVNQQYYGTFLITGVSDDGTQLQVAASFSSIPSPETVLSSTLTLASTNSVTEGDNVVITTPFSPENRGTFTVVRGGDVSTGVTNSIWYKNDNSVEETVVAGPLLTYTYSGSIVSANNGYQTITVPSLLVDAWIGRADELTIAGFTNTSNNGKFVILSVTKDLSNTYINVMNTSAIAETAGATITAKRPALKFYPYDTTMANDTLAIGFSSGFGLAAYNGTYTIASVIDKNNATLTQNVSSSSSVNLGGDYTNINVVEQTPYSNYKRIYSLVVNGLNSNLGFVSFDTINQAAKIGSAGGTVMTAVNKLGFDTNTVVGQYSYKYDTGLIGEANRICYGDPRDTTTYPGVVATGAELFIKTPLVKKVTMTLSVRTYSGVPFTVVANQIKNSVAAFVDNNPIGTPIPISGIIAVVTAVQGVLSVVVDSPLYNSSQDEILLNPGEKAWILNLDDIAVIQLG